MIVFDGRCGAAYPWPWRSLFIHCMKYDHNDDSWSEMMKWRHKWWKSMMVAFDQPNLDLGLLCTSTGRLWSNRQSLNSLNPMNNQYAGKANDFKGQLPRSHNLRRKEAPICCRVKLLTLQSSKKWLYDDEDVNDDDGDNQQRLKRFKWMIIMKLTPRWLWRAAKQKWPERRHLPSLQGQLNSLRGLREKGFQLRFDIQVEIHIISSPALWTNGTTLTSPNEGGHKHFWHFNK